MRSVRRWLAAVPFAAIAVIALSGWHAFRQRCLTFFRGSEVAVHALPSARTPLVPTTLQFHLPASLASGPDLRAVEKRFQLAAGSSVSDVIHALHAFRMAPNLLDSGVPFSSLLSVLLDQRAADNWYRGALTVVRTRHGFKYVTAKLASSRGVAAQAHIDQVLALLAELGLPPDTRISTREGTVRIEDFLTESTASFRLSGEFEWSALVRAQYFPDCPQWGNRFGETFDFDKVACALIAKPLDQYSCGGTHGLYALAVIAQVDEETKCLTGDVRQLINDYLRALADFVGRRLQSDGSFDTDWYFDAAKCSWYEKATANARAHLSTVESVAFPEPRAARRGESVAPHGATLSQKVLVTGHHLEWLFLRAAHDQPADSIIRAALRFLAISLNCADESEIRANYCPYSHALSVLIRMRQARTFGITLTTS